jgi:hypothetical protein
MRIYTVPPSPVGFLRFFFKKSLTKTFPFAQENPLSLSLLLPEVQAGRVECGALIQDGGQSLVLEHVVTHQQAQQGFGQLPPAVVPYLPDNTRTKLIYFLPI